MQRITKIVQNCSLYDICIPKITKKKKNVLNYMNSKIYGDLE